MEAEPLTFNITKYDFEFAIGRQPKDQQELKKFTKFVEKGIENRLDWVGIFQTRI